MLLGGVEHCPIDHDVLAMFVEVEFGWAEVLLANGERLADYAEGFGRPSAWCKAQCLPVTDVIEVSASNWDISANPRVLAASALFGTHHCALD